MYFVQHGRCVDKTIDPDRPLSNEGREEVERVATHLHKAGIAVAQIHHSGKTRARQTAELFAEQVEADSVTELSGMNPNDDVLDFLAMLEDNTMYVGHLPHLARLLSFLTAGNGDADVIKFSNAGVICLGKDEANYAAEWILTPAICL